MKEIPDIVPYSQWLLNFTDEEISEIGDDRYLWRSSEWYSASDEDRIDMVMRNVYHKYIKQDKEKYAKWLNK